MKLPIFIVALFSFFLLTSCHFVPNIEEDGLLGFDTNNDNQAEILIIESWQQLYQLVDANAPAKKGLTFTAEGDTIAWRYGLDSIVIDGVKISAHGNGSFGDELEGIMNHHKNYDRLTFSQLWDCYILRSFEVGTWTNCGLFEEREYTDFQRFYIHLNQKIYWWPTAYFQIDWCYSTNTGCNTPCEDWVGEVEEIHLYLD